MDLSLAIISLSLILQLSSAFLAGRLVLLTGNRIAGIIIVTAVSLMGFRRGITFYRLISGKAIKLDLFAEIIALIMSFFGLVGVLYVTRLILTIRRLNEERKKAEEEQRKSSTEIQDLYDNAPCGYHSLDKDGVFVRINNTELSWLGYSRNELLWKKKFSDIMTPESSEVFGKNSSFFKETGWIRDAEYELICADGTVKTVLLSVSAVKDPDDKYIMSRAGLFDITERKRVEDALKKARDEKEALRDSHDHYRVLATRDSLTGLYNRHYFNEIIHRELDRAKRYGENLSIIIVDIDNFKQLNDTYGHQHGDGVLKECAAILNRAIRGSDILCRFGGDEFMIVTPETDCTENNAITSRIDEHISEWNRQFSTLGYELSISVGCAMWESGKDLIEVMKEADSSMYANKKSKKAQKE
jgi:diguanylate cyclase (GGDEF)-like protein/PAS domain S-box-containing protein